MGRVSIARLVLLRAISRNLTWRFAFFRVLCVIFRVLGKEGCEERKSEYGGGDLLGGGARVGMRRGQGPFRGEG